MIRLDLGAGDKSPDGYIAMGRKHGTEIFPLGYADDSVDEIRASHVLEHFGRGHVQDVLKDWVRALKPGGRIKLAVPDFARVAQGYLEGEPLLTQQIVMGSQEDADDFHKMLFDRDVLRSLMASVGLVLLRPWTSDIEDCAAYPISLNLEGTKPFMSEIKVSAAMSVPRLGFMDNFSACIDAFLPLNIKLRRQGGAFWGQALTNCLEDILAQDNPDAIMCLDYDTVFTKGNVAHLMQLMMAHPEADAIAPIQSSRHLPTALFTVKGEDGKPMSRLNTEELAPDLKRVDTAHFGLTLIRADKLRALPKPWFQSVPSPAGDWRDGHVDEDINFWVKWGAAGNTLMLANRVVIGHAELMVRWPGEDLQAFFQPMHEFNKQGVPAQVWK